METGVSGDNNKSALIFTEIEPNEKFGSGKLYKVGAVEVEVYEKPSGIPPLVLIRAPGVSMALYHIANVRSNNDGGILLDFARVGQKEHASLSIILSGDIAFIYSLPPAAMGMTESGKIRKVKGVEYNQSTIDVAGTPEGIRVQIKGTVDASPRLVVPTIRNSPLMFFLIEDNPKDPKNPVYHEVWADKAARQELQRAKLIRGSVIEAVLYRKVLDLTTIGGEKETITRNYLAKLIYVAKKPSPKG